MKLFIIVFMISLLLAYVLMPCSSPYKKVGLQCCLDNNENEVCDGQEIKSHVSECDSPYIFSADGCCLDINVNGICDINEQILLPSTTVANLIVKTTTTAYTTSTTHTVTTTSETSTTTTTTSTTTTLSIYELAKVNGCYDSDGGETYDVLGTTVGKVRKTATDMVTQKDVCMNNQTLKEYRCQNLRIYSRTVLCESEQVCKSGKCCLVGGKQCKASRDCCSGECVKRLTSSLCS